MKHFIFLSFLFWCACTGTRSNNESSASTAKSGQKETIPAPTAADFHYVVTTKFSATQATPAGAVREAGEAVLIVVPASEMFVAVYEGDHLTHYADFANPLRVRGTDSAEQATPSAQAPLLFPAWAADGTRMTQADIGIYTVKGYNSSFAETLRSKSALQAAVAKGTYEKTYTLSGRQLADLLKGI
jgi:hypothetical protein